MKLASITKIENSSVLFDIQTVTENFFANEVLVHNSMIHTVSTSHGILLKSKKTFDSDVAKSAYAWMIDQKDLNVLYLITECHANNMTAIFEWTAPDARIVLHYTNPELRLLHVRENESGRYLSGDELRVLSDKFEVLLVDEPVFDVPKEQLGNHLLALAKTVEGIEGWVIQFENGNMVKLKTDWYLKRHRAMTFLRERDIAQMVLEEAIDDLKALLVGENVNIQEVLDIEKTVMEELVQIILGVDMLYEQNKNLERKDFAIKFTGHQLFGLLMQKYSGKNPDCKGYFEKNILKDKYSLRQLVLVQSVAKGD